MDKNHSEQSADPTHGGDINLMEILIALGVMRRWLFGIPLLVGLVVLGGTLFMPNKYTAETTLLPPGQGGGGGLAALASGLAGGGLVDLAGLGSAGGKKAELYIGILQSHSVWDVLIEQFHLIERYGKKSREETYAQLKKVVSIEVDKKSGLLRIMVEDADPEFAAKLANAHYDVLSQVLSRVAITEAQKKRVFFEKQFQSAKQSLSDAEVNLKKTQQTTGVLEIKTQAAVALEAAASLRAQIVQREVQLSALKGFATENNQDYKRIAGELVGLRAALSKLEKRNSSDPSLVSSGNLPEQGLEYVRAYREVKYQEAIFEAMAKQLEIAKLEEAKDGNELQQLDVAVPPEKKSSPKRVLLVLLAVFVSAILMLICAVLRFGCSRMFASQDSNAILRLKAAWGGRSRS
jgi:tyrosine-protein kinase Etk/Wzc